MKKLNFLLNLFIVSVFLSFILTNFFFTINIKDDNCLPLKYKPFLIVFTINFALTVFLSVAGFFTLKILTSIKFHTKRFLDEKTIVAFIFPSILYFSLQSFISLEKYIYFLDSKQKNYIILLFVLSLVVIFEIFFISKKSTIDWSFKWFYLPVLTTLFLAGIGFYINKNLSKQCNINKQKNTKPLEIGTETFFNVKKTRRIIVLYIEGLSPDLLLSIMQKRELSNFELIMKKGSWGRVKSFKPVYKLSHLATFLQGDYPRQHGLISTWKYVFDGEKDFSFQFKPFLSPISFLEDLGFYYKILSIKNNIKEKLFIKLKKRKIPINFNITFFEEYYLDIPTQKKVLIDEPNLIFTKKGIYELKDIEEKILFLSLKKDVNSFKNMISILNDKGYVFLFYYLDGLLEVERIFLKYKYPNYYPNINEDKIVKYKEVIDRYYNIIDTNLGKIISNLKENDILIVSSSFGIEPINPFFRALELSKKNNFISGSFKTAPDGIIMFLGRYIREGKTLQNYKLINTYSVLLYYLGYPLTKEMIKNTQLTMFNSEFLKENPIIFIEEKK